MGLLPPAPQLPQPRDLRHRCTTAEHPERHRGAPVLEHGTPSAAAGWEPRAEQFPVGQPVRLPPSCVPGGGDAQTGGLTCHQGITSSLCSRLWRPWQCGARSSRMASMRRCYVKQRFGVRCTAQHSTAQHSTTLRSAPLLPVLHSGQSQSPSGMLFGPSPIQRRWKAAGQVSQQMRLPPSPHSGQLSILLSSSAFWTCETPQSTPKLQPT